ncbi:MAG: phosphate ABC transporter ATP-binding protein [Solirubrobacteraceae bacterium]|nr:phosphate ABC transporter ATP-binding protein [Solirubrobacteraceae bacterium]
MQPTSTPPADPATDLPANFPPPVRRITLDRTPTVVAPSAEPVHHTPIDGALERGATRDRMTIDNLTVSYAGSPAVKGVTLPIRDQEVLALIGPSGCGKSTLLRTLNRLTELTPGASYTGLIALDGADVRGLPVTDLRRRVSMVFQQPNPFPMSIFDNVAYAIREQSKRAPGRAALAPRVESALKRAGLWDEVAHDLDRPALRLSGGQQQRLCIARALAVEPEVMLMDEPCSALDPKSTMVIEELIRDLRKSLAVVIVTHNLQQARRVGDHVAFMYLGDLVEYAPAEQLFTEPQAERTREYVSGAFG